MLISCKCLNFVASGSGNGNGGFCKLNQFDKNNQSSNNNRNNSIAAAVGNNSDGGAGTGDENRCNNNALVRGLMDAFQQRYSRGFPFFQQCIELIGQTIGPLAGLSVTIHQRDLICTLPCDSWDLKICINCNTALCAKGTNGQTSVYLINSNLLITNEELAHRKADKSFSETFGIRIMDHQKQQINQSPFHSDENKKVRNSRVRSLTQSLQTKLQKDIAETDERILRYTEQQFALLKSQREKSEQEYQILVSLVNQVPEQVINAMGETSNSASVPTTPTTLAKITIGGGGNGGGVATPNSSASAMDSSSSNIQVSLSSSVSSQSVFHFNNNANTTTNNNNSNKKVSSFDTPPATPESTPMSVGNSPTFNRQQQQQQPTSIGIHVAGSGNRSLIGTGVFYLNSTSSSNSNGVAVEAVDVDGDCLFELEGVDSGYTMAPRSSLPSHMSDMEEIAEGAEEALDELEDTAIPIPNIHNKRRSVSNFARSLPIAIANSVTDATLIADSDDDLLDDNVDIAASIKALARSVHGDAVFGELPRPRLGTQI